MNPRLARGLTRLYPRAWRERYGEEFEALLERGPGDMRTLADSVGSAAREHIFPTQGGAMEAITFGTMLRRPSAYMPVGMSLLALTILLCALGYGRAHPGPADTDEGSVAHLWQLLMTLQMPIVLFFLVKWVRRAPQPTLEVLALQAGVWLASCAPVYLLHL